MWFRVSASNGRAESLIVAEILLAVAFFRESVVAAGWQVLTLLWSG